MTLPPTPEHDPEDEMTGGSPDEVSTREATAAQARTWGPLELREPLGKGAFGTVFRAWDPRLTKEVALKVLRSRHPLDAGSAALTEARRLARIRHPHVVSVFGADVFEGNVGFWMELIRGITLEQQLRRNGALGPAEATSLGIAMAQALAAVHGSGVVHGDVKARNIMREDGGRYVLTDFGASSDLGTLTGDVDAAIIGTPLYMAPEVLRGARPSHASDIYSLGVLLFHCVTRQYPVNGATMADVAAAHDRGTRRYLRDVRPDLPTSFVQVVERALASDPAARFATAGAFEGALVGLAPAKPSVSRRTLVGVLMAGAAIAVAAVASWLSRGTPPAPLAVPSEIRTVAVLPFDHNGTPADESFSRGFTDLLTARLCEVASLRVVSQTSARQVRARSLVLPEVARVLGADAVVEGSIQSSAGRVRVDARLVHAGTDAVIWTKSFESGVGDILKMQAELALAVGQQLRQALTVTEQQRLATMDTTSREAQDAFLRGWAALESQSVDGAREAVRQFKAAIGLDPNYARAHAVLSHAYWLLGVGLTAMPRSESQDLAVAAARRALQLDPNLPRAHAALAQVHFYFDWDWKNAGAEFEKAIALNPSDADAHQQYGWFLAALGRLEPALGQMKRARELDPLSNSRRSPVAAVLYYDRRYNDAIAELDQMLAITPAFRPAHFGLARAYAGQNRTAEALRHLAEARTDSPAYLAELGRVHAQAGNVAEATTLLRTLEARRAASPELVPLDALAILHAALGHTNQALEMVEEAYRQRAPILVWLKVDPRYDSLRTQPRFISVLKAMGLT